MRNALDRPHSVLFEEVPSGLAPSLISSVTATYGWNCWFEEQPVKVGARFQDRVNARVRILTDRPPLDREKR